MNPNLLAQAIHFIDANIGETHPRRAWLNAGEGKMYVRFGRRIVNGSQRPTFTLATIEIDEAVRHQGVFSALMDGIVRAVPIIVESVISEYVERVIERKGFVRQKNDQFSWELDVPSNIERVGRERKV